MVNGGAPCLEGICDAAAVLFILDRQWKRLGNELNSADFADHQAVVYLVLEHGAEVVEERGDEGGVVVVERLRGLCDRCFGRLQFGERV